MPTTEERGISQRFGDQYRIAPTDVAARIEQVVIGGDWGANGYTTMAQADRLGDLCELGPGGRLLDWGSGRGWPGLFLAQRTGCRVVLSDVPVEGLRSAQRRARQEDLSARASAVVATARHLPFASGGFDAVIHSDALC